MNNKLKLIFVALISIVAVSCNNTENYISEAQKLGFAKDKKVLILHADDAGLSSGTNEAIIKYLENNEIQSSSVMAPCPSFTEFIDWAKANTNADIGMHLTLTSEWKTYRWSSIEDSAKVPHLIDNYGKLWPEVVDVVKHGNADEVKKEIRAQIELAKSIGYNPSHLDSHMGTLFGSSAFANAYLNVAEEYGIPATVVSLSNPKVVELFRKKGFPIDDAMIKRVIDYKLPKLDFYTSVPNGKTYEEIRSNFLGLLNKIPAGLTEIYFHPSADIKELKTITNSWQRRAWEAELFADPVVIKYFEDNNIEFTNWKEIMKRFNNK